ncbi:MAG: hypothetical protein NZ934_04255 [Hadesarchaea archaeon]|nr:hypothetical protein [Hadesarchaea archaeon]
MPALRVLASVILASLAVLTFTMGYRYAEALARARDAKEAAMEVDAAVRAVTATGDPKKIGIRIPDGYVLKFEGNRITLDGTTLPEGSYPLPIVGPELGPGTHVLTISLENGTVSVST